MNEQWKNKKVAFLGDSITDKVHVGTVKNYWEYLAESCGLIPLVYGINGQRWGSVREQAEKLLAEHGSEVDAIFVFMGTNDYNGSVPPGDWFVLQEEENNYHGVMKKKLRRHFNMDKSTLKGCINDGMSFLKKHFPLQQIILLTPIHRGFACFSETNVQPEESFPNELDLYTETYIGCIREAGNIWAVPVIDLNAVCGLFPMMDEYARYFHLADTDRLHPNAAGHRRMAEALKYQLQMFPASFKEN